MEIFTRSGGGVFFISVFDGINSVRFVFGVACLLLAALCLWFCGLASASALSSSASSATSASRFGWRRWRVFGRSSWRSSAPSPPCRCHCKYGHWSKRARNPLARSAPFLAETKRNQSPVTADNNAGYCAVTGWDDTEQVRWRKIEKLPSSVPEDSFSESDAIFDWGPGERGRETTKLMQTCSQRNWEN